MDYVEYILGLEKEWSPERLKQLVLDFLREGCTWTREKKKMLEIENSEARRRGVSYAERKKYSTQIQSLDVLFEKWKQRGIEYNKKDIHLREFIDPEDVEYTCVVGVEHQIKAAITF